MKINTLATGEEEFLQGIEYIAYAPKTLCCIGKLPNRRVPTVAIVGSRKPTPYGKEVTHRLAYDLAKQGVVIISGLALGIDSIAHRAALEAGGMTIAVLAGGLDSISPSSHTSLAEQIVKQGGALLSEYPAGTVSYPSQFLARNRLISAIADMVIVTEAAGRSGSLNTAHHALEQNKEVGAVPGNITSSVSKGTNDLLRQGAHVITSAKDVLQIIAPRLTIKQTMIPLGNNAAETTIIHLIHQGIRNGDELLRQSKLPADQFLQTLTMLELSGTITALTPNHWALTVQQR